MKNNSLLISVVIPIYNNGNIIKQMLDSILAQSFQSFECICIDDSSTDIHTIEILKQYNYKYDKIRCIFSENNCGAGYSRNLGMKYAQGEYIIFLDADDIFDREMLLEMYNVISESNADISICSHQEFYVKNNQHILSNIIIPKRIGKNINNIFEVSLDKEDVLTFWSTAPWNKLFKRSFIEKNKIRFQNLKSSNDVYFSIVSVLLANKIVYTKTKAPLLFYRVGQSTQISSNRNPLDFQNAILSTMKIIKEKKIRKENKVLIFLLNNMIYELKYSKNENNSLIFYEFVQKYIKNQYKYVTFEDNFYNNIKYYIINKRFESKWYEIFGNYLEQLLENKEALIRELSMFQYIILWGNGRRGESFQQFCINYGILLLGVTDQLNINVGMKTPFLFDIVDNITVKTSCDCIVACNKEVYFYLIKKYKRKKIINLQQYCPY